MNQQFLRDVLDGLSKKEKSLQSKYFYDHVGDEIFKKIMACEEYYPTRCEMEIFTTQREQLVSTLAQQETEFDIVELGAGDASKTIHLLRAMADDNRRFTYYPIDISSNVITQLHKNLPKQLPGMDVHGLNGEYFEMLDKARELSTRRKVVLFLGSNIGNVPLERAVDFCNTLRSHLNVGDLALVGFDLKKDPRTVLNAYNDKAGLTRDFNLNVLTRINNELKGNFDVSSFYHYPTYDPATGACRSFLVSTKEQQASVAGKAFSFEAGEPIYTEISQKFTVKQTDEIATGSGFKPVKHFLDSKRWFLDAVWECV